MKNVLTTLLKQKDRLLTFGVYLVVFLSSIHGHTDRDWGWHFKYGEYFFMHGKILMGDIFTWTLPGFVWTNHSWGYDLLLYTLTKSIGFTGLALLAGAVITFIFWLLTTTFQLSYWKMAIVAIFFCLLIQVGIEEGLRSQVVSMIFFALLVRLLLQTRLNWKKLWFLPPLFFLWANIHGDFTIGLGIMAVFLISYLGLEAWKLKDLPEKSLWRYGGVIGLCIAATLVNPFGYRGYMESFNHSMNPYLKNVLEWDPVYDNCPSCHAHTLETYCLVLAILFVIGAWKRDSRFVPFFLLAAILVWPTFSTRRLQPIFLIVTLPVLMMSLKEMRWDLGKLKVVPFLVGIGILIGFEFNLYNRFRDLDFYQFKGQDYRTEALGFSPKLLEYAKDHPPEGKGLNFYDWGGYLIGNDFPAKLFVDGRMHVWKDEEGYQPFADYIEMYYNKNYDLFRRYDFDWALLPDDSDLARVIKTSNDLGKWQYGFQDGNTDYFVRVRDK